MTSERRDETTDDDTTQPPLENGVAVSEDAGTVMAVDVEEEIEKAEADDR